MVTYNRDIPDAPNNPSNDQPKMRQNTNATYDILNVDHITFNETNGGYHKQVNFQLKTSHATPTDPQSVLYTADGVANTVSELYFSNQNGVYNASSLKAFGLFSTQNTNGAVPITTSVNVSSITASANGQTNTIALSAGTVVGTTVMVVATLSNGGSVSWSYALNTLTLSISAGSTGGQLLSFFVYQI